MNLKGNCMSKYFDLTGKVAVVSGASSGLGRDAALAYAEAGADVAILARRIDKLEDLSREIKETYDRRVLALACDVTKEEDCKQAIEKTIEHFSRIDILLNNAGIAVPGSVDSMSEEQWDKSFDTNVKGIFLMSKYVIPVMKEQKYGRVVNIASVNAIIADKNPPFLRHSYNASKAAVLGLTTGMAASYAQFGITVNALGPGLFESEMTQDTLFKSDAFLNQYNALCPSSRPGKQGELNGPIIFFSSDACSYVTGQFFTVDGGTTLV